MREKIKDLVPPFGLLTTPRDFSQFVANEYISQRPGEPLTAQVLADGVLVRQMDSSPQVWRNISQRVFSDEDVEWYLTRQGVKNKRLVSLMDGNLDLLKTAQRAEPHLSYFSQTLKTGQRMKKPVHQVQPCIMIAAYTTRFHDMQLPIPVLDWVLNKAPRYGAWLEQHIDRFYEVLNACK